MSANRVPTKLKKEWFLAHVALWQFLAFLLLLIVIWVIELFGVTAFFFGPGTGGMALFRASVLSVAVIIVAIIAVGNTYIQQEFALKGLLVVCTTCRKVKVRRDVWENLDRYIEEKTLAKLTHEVCPECLKAMEQQIVAANVQAWKPKPSGSSA